MADYIDRQEVIKKLEELDSRLMRGHYVDECAGVTMANAVVQSVPAADVKPVVHGRWEMKPENTTPGIYHVKKAFCTNCGKPNKQYRPPYCPHCGAKMDEGGTT